MAKDAFHSDVATMAPSGTSMNAARNSSGGPSRASRSSQAPSTRRRARDAGNATAGDAEVVRGVVGPPAMFTSNGRRPGASPAGVGVLRVLELRPGVHPLLEVGGLDHVVEIGDLLGLCVLG